MSYLIDGVMVLLEKIKKLDISRCWIVIFCLFFLSVIFTSTLIQAVVFLLILAVYAYKYSTRKFGLFLFILAFAVRLVIIFVVQTPASSDFSILLNASRSLNRGDLSFLETSYFQLWSYQVGFVFFRVCFFVFGIVSLF